MNIQLKSLKPKARKDHKCDFCQQKIAKGNVYLKTSCVHEGSVYDWKSHISCNELTKILKMYDDCYYEGLTSDAFQEHIINAYDNIMSGMEVFRSANYKYPEFSQIIKMVKEHHLTTKSCQG